MPDFLPQSGPQQGGPPQAEGGPTPEGQLSSPPAEQVQQMIPPQQGGGPIGGTGLAQIEPAPKDYPDEDASPEQQKEYEDLFIRVMSAVHDVRKPPKGKKSMADSVIELMSNKDQEPQASIGTAAGMTMFNIITMAKRQKKEYDPDVIREVGMDLVGELYMIASKSGAIANLPEEESQEGQAILQQAALEATKLYGEQSIATGQTNQQEHMNEVQHQMQREADSGELDNWGMEEFDDQSRLDLARRIGDVTRGS